MIKMLLNSLTCVYKFMLPRTPVFALTEQVQCFYIELMFTHVVSADSERRDARAAKHGDASWTRLCWLPLLQPVHHE